MSFLLNSFIYAGGGGYPNTYSINLPTWSTTPANIEFLKIDNQSNAIDTALRDTTPNFSVSGWFKLTASEAGQTRILFAKYDNFGGNDRCLQISIDTTNKFAVYGQYDLNNSSVSLQTNATYSNSNGWIHYCFVYDCTQTTSSTIAKLYINGVEVTSFTTQTVSTTNKYFMNQGVAGSRARIGTINFAGASANLPSRGLSGWVDEMTFWDKSLSSSEVTQLYNSGKAYNVSLMSAYSTNCLAWWRMGDYGSDNWDGTKWNIVNVKGTASTNLVSVNLVNADRVTDVP